MRIPTDQHDEAYQETHFDTFALVGFFILLPQFGIK